MNPICPILSNGVHPYLCPQGTCAWWTGTGCAVSELPGNLLKVSETVHELQDGLMSIATELDGLV